MEHRCPVCLLPLSSSLPPRMEGVFSPSCRNLTLPHFQVASISLFLGSIKEQGEKIWLDNKETLIEKYLQNITPFCMNRILFIYIVMSLVIGLSSALSWEHLENRTASILSLNPQKLQHTAQNLAQSHSMIDK